MSDFMVRYEAERANTRAQLPAHKQALLDALHLAGIPEVRVEISGSGDDGGIDYVEPELSPELREQLETYVYAKLEVEAAGWENNDGGYGTFEINTANPEGQWEFYYRVTTAELAFEE